MKILFTSVGRRVELIQAFRNAAINLNIDLKIYGSDVADTAPALVFCDEKILSPKIDEKNYISFLVNLCEKEKINALVPTIDTDLLLLSQNKEKFLNTKIVVSEEDKIKICRDKTLVADFFSKIGLNTPTPCDDCLQYRGGFPAFIKPKDGSSSINAYKIYNNKELKIYSQEVPDYIVAPFIEGKEYTVDAFCDFEGNPIYITPRIRLAVRSGEVLKTQMVQDEVIIDECEKIINAFKPCGAITIQLIRQSITGDDYFIEINPRFGGGAPLSMKAGADSAEALLRLLRGEKLYFTAKAAEEGAVYSRYDQSVRVK